MAAIPVISRDCSFFVPYQSMLKYIKIVIQTYPKVLVFNQVIQKLSKAKPVNSRRMGLVKNSI